ncbi:hypothetical protein BD289DRAFT_438582 [Coniella lustricola]|uniref:Rhodopsin domain-containing protein n=1 Tax=Coniella lustricola TaxID=2025994 RepID=A0A2T3A2U5_9PEZI|nr:hypothetical protein BD289DRAFT_438582 [Coniella lustricola]
MTTTYTMAIDTTIEAIFGSPPEGTNLNDSLMTGYSVVSCVVMGLAVIAVLLRLYVRTTYNTELKNLAVDDYAIVVALVFTGGLLATTLVASTYGAGKHIWSTNVPRLMALLKVVFAEPWVYAASVTSTKFSILLLYRRLFYMRESKLVDTDRSFSIIFWIATCLTGTYPIVMWVVMACACRPLSFYWRQYAGATDGICIDVLQFYLVFGIFNMIYDMIILVIPIPRITKLHMSAKKKVSIAGIMLLGSFVCVASIVRIYYLKKLTVEIDVTWILGPAFGWSSLEPSVAIISACLPTYAPLFRSFRSKATRNSSSARNGSHSGHLRIQEYGQQSQGYFHGHSSIYIEEDEVQLTDRKHNSRNMQSQHSSGEPGCPRPDAITVETRVEVISQENHRVGQMQGDHTS